MYNQDQKYVWVYENCKNKTKYDEISSYFQVSLIFLLFDNVDIALQYILQIQSGVAKQPLAEWSSHALACNDKFWPNKLIEAVAIIQNYKVLKNLGKRTLNTFTTFFCIWKNP